MECSSPPSVLCSIQATHPEAGSAHTRRESLPTAGTVPAAWWADVVSTHLNPASHNPTSRLPDQPPLKVLPRIPGGSGDI